MTTITTTTTTTHRGHDLMVIARAAYATTAALRANERLLGATCLILGAVIYYVASRRPKGG